MTATVDEQLRQAASQGDLAAVTAALEQGADIHSRGSFGDTALNEAAENGHIDTVRLLLEAGADIHNVGGADKTPIMNAAFAGHVETVQLLLDNGAQVNHDLLSSVQMKVNILEENAEAGMVNPAAVEAWQGFHRFLVKAWLKQELPATVAALSAAEREEWSTALDRLQTTANRGIDVTAAVPRLNELLSDEDGDVRYTASKVLTTHYAFTDAWTPLTELAAVADSDVREGVISTIVAAAQGGFDLRPLQPVLINFLTVPSLNVRHDAAVALGYLATSGFDVAGTIPNLAGLLADEAPEARKMAAWALYRIAKYIADIGAAVPDLQARLADEDEGVREMAAEALQMAESRNS